MNRGREKRDDYHYGAKRAMTPAQLAERRESERVRGAPLVTAALAAIRADSVRRRLGAEAAAAEYARVLRYVGRPIDDLLMEG